jgi:hypothetical protein
LRFFGELGDCFAVGRKLKFELRTFSPRQSQFRLWLNHTANKLDN